MEIRIKKEYLETVLGSACALSGVLFVYLLLEMLRENGAFGYVVFVIFFVTLIWNILHWRNRKAEYEAAEKFAQKYLDDQVKTNPDMFDQITYWKAKDELKHRSVKMVRKDEYVLKIKKPSRHNK